MRPSTFEIVVGLDVVEVPRGNRKGHDGDGQEGQGRIIHPF
jgi:hypothetical protein